MDESLLQQREECSLLNSKSVCMCVFLHCGRVDVFPYTCFEGLWRLLLLGFLQGDAGLLPLLLLLLQLLFSLCCNLKNPKSYKSPQLHNRSEDTEATFTPQDFMLSYC